MNIFFVLQLISCKVGPMYVSRKPLTAQIDRNLPVT